MLPQLIRGRALALLRSSRFLGTDDLLFLIRHNRAQIARLRHYLAWKDVRKKAKQDQESKGEEVAEVEDMAGGGEADAAGQSARCGVGYTGLGLTTREQTRNPPSRSSSCNGSC